VNNQDLAKEILKLIGGKDNVSTATHCATRLRVNLKNDKKADLTALDKLPDVIRAQFSSGQLQVVLGGKVAAVYKEFQELLPENDGDSEEPTEKKKLSFGLLIESFQLVSSDSDIVKLLQMTGDLIFYFLPFFLAVSASKKFKTNEYMAIALAAAYMYPTIQNGALQAAETGIRALDFFGLPLLFVNYKSTVFPIILAVWIMSYISKWIEKAIPDMLKILLAPLLTLLIMVPLQLGALGPIGSYLGIYIAQGVNWLYNTGGFVGAFLLGAMRPVLVMFGMHYAITPIMVQEVAETGKTVIIPALLAGNLAQAGAAFAVAFKLKNKVEKTGAFTAATTAFLGITEPAMYGYNLKYKKPFYAALLSAGIAAAYMSIFKAYSNAVALPGILAVSTYTATSFIHIIIGVVIAVVGAFVLTMILGIGNQEEVVATETATTTTTVDANKDVVAKEVQEIHVPIPGARIDLSEVPDEMFSQKLLGDGFAIRPTEGKVYAPFDGTVEMIFDTYHAIGLKSTTGTEVLIHIGIDTVNLKGEGFTPKVKAGDQIKTGDLLMAFDINKIINNGYAIETPVVVTNGVAFTVKD
jgi:PTS system beta-glucosides-specific IIC component